MASYKNIFKITNNDTLPIQGSLLISEPFSRDAYFQRSVVLLVEHTIHGSMGFIVNKKTDLTVTGATLKSDADPTYNFNGGGAGGTGYGIVLAGYKSGTPYEGDYEKAALISDNTFELKAGDGYALFVYDGSNDHVTAN